MLSGNLRSFYSTITCCAVSRRSCLRPEDPPAASENHLIKRQGRVLSLVSFREETFVSSMKKRQKQRLCWDGIRDANLHPVRADSLQRDGLTERRGSKEPSTV